MSGCGGEEIIRIAKKMERMVQKKNTVSRCGDCTGRSWHTPCIPASPPSPCNGVCWGFGQPIRGCLCHLELQNNARDWRYRALYTDLYRGGFWGVEEPEMSGVPRSLSAGVPMCQTVEGASEGTLIIDWRQAEHPGTRGRNRRMWEIPAGNGLYKRNALPELFLPQVT